MGRISQLLVAAVGDVKDVTILQQLQRKVKKQLQVVGAPASQSNGTAQPAAKAAKPQSTVQAQKTDPAPANGAPTMHDASGTNGTDLSTLYTVGQEIVFGTAHGEHTRAKITKVNRKRLQAELLEPRGRKKPLPAGTVVDVDPHIFEVQAA